MRMPRSCQARWAGGGRWWCEEWGEQGSVYGGVAHQGPHQRSQGVPPSFQHNKLSLRLTPKASESSLASMAPEASLSIMLKHISMSASCCAVMRGRTVRPCTRSHLRMEGLRRGKASSNLRPGGGAHAGVSGQPASDPTPSETLPRGPLREMMQDDGRPSNNTSHVPSCCAMVEGPSSETD